MSVRNNLTVGELITQLSKLDQTMILHTDEWESEYMCTHIWGVGGVDESGRIYHGDLLHSFPDEEFEYDEEDKE